MLSPASIAGSTPPLLSATSQRDERLDLLRGFCVLKMIHAHGAWTVLHPALDWLAWDVAAEGYFFISGMVIGLIACRQMTQNKLGALGRKLLRRSFWLMVCNVVLAGVFSVWDLLGREYGFFHFGYTYKWMFKEGWYWHSVLVFDFPYYLYILPRYVVFLAIAPMAILLLARLPRGYGAAILLALSGGLWAAEHLPGVQLLLPFFEVGLPYGFRLASWQMPFFIGLIIGFERQNLVPLWKRLSSPSGVAVLATTALGCLLLHLVIFHHHWLELPSGFIYKLFDHDQLGLVRVVNAAALLSIAFILINRFREPLTRRLGWLLLPLSRQSLAAFLLHVPALYLIQAVMESIGWGSPYITHLANLLLLCVVVMVCIGIDRNAQRKRGAVPGRQLPQN